MPGGKTLQAAQGTALCCTSRCLNIQNTLIPWTKNVSYKPTKINCTCEKKEPIGNTINLENFLCSQMTDELAAKCRWNCYMIRKVGN